MKRIESPTKKWPGYILLHDPLPLVKVAAFEEAIRNVDRDNLAIAGSQSKLLPALIPCVAEWHLEGFPKDVTPETFPGTPRTPSSILVSAIIKEITLIYKGDEGDDPNA